MTRRLVTLVVVLAALCVLYFALVRDMAPRSWASRSAAPRPSGEGADMANKPGPYPTEYDEVTVSIDIPPVSEFPAGWAESDGCPHSRVSGALGAAIGPGNGCPVLNVEPGGPADKAGIQRFDRLGEPGDCAMSLYRSFKPRKEARTVEWTVRRPKGQAPESPAADQPADEHEHEETSA